jgi:hypothetical protein
MGRLERSGAGGQDPLKARPIDLRRSPFFSITSLLPFLRVLPFQPRGNFLPALREVPSVDRERPCCQVRELVLAQAFKLPRLLNHRQHLALVLDAEALEQGDLNAHRALSCQLS